MQSAQSIHANGAPVAAEQVARPALQLSPSHTQEAACPSPESKAQSLAMFTVASSGSGVVAAAAHVLDAGSMEAALGSVDASDLECGRMAGGEGAPTDADTTVGCEEDDDFDACSAGKSKNQPHKEAAASSCLRRRRVHLCALLVSVMGMVGLTLVFRPREPQWSLKKLDINTTQFAEVMLGTAQATEPLSLTSDVSFFNPNFIGSTMEPGSFVVRLGEDVLATGTTDGGHVGARSSADVHATVSMALGEAMSKKIMDTLQKDNFMLTVSAEVVKPARVFGFLRVVAHVKCIITSDAMKVMTVPEGTIVSKTCSYSYSL